MYECLTASVFSCHYSYWFIFSKAFFILVWRCTRFRNRRLLWNDCLFPLALPGCAASICTTSGLRLILPILPFLLFRVSLGLPGASRTCGSNVTPQCRDACRLLTATLSDASGAATLPGAYTTFQLFCSFLCSENTHLPLLASDSNNFSTVAVNPFYCLARIYLLFPVVFFI